MEGNKNYIVNNQGEILKEIGENDRIVRGSSIEFYENSIEIDNVFIKLFVNNIMPVIEQLKDKRGKIKYNTISLMFYLMQFISYKNGFLQHENGKPLTNKYILENFNMSKTELYNSLKLLKDKNIISIVESEGELKFYMFNPWIASIGQRIDKTHLYCFENSPYKKNKEE